MNRIVNALAAALLALPLAAPAAAKADPLEKPFAAAAQDFNRGHYDEAARFYRIIRNTYKGSDWEARAGLYLAQCYGRQGKPEDQSEVLRQVARDFGPRPEGFEAWLQLASLDEQAGDLGSAAKDYQQAVQAAPDSALAPIALVDLAYLQARAKQEDAAMATFTQLASQYPKSDLAQREANQGKARLLRRQRRFAEAATAYQAIVQNAPADSPAAVQARFAIAQTWQQAGQYDRAAQAYASLAADIPEQAGRARAYQGLSLIADGRAKEAREPLQRVVDEEPGTLWAEVAAKALAGAAPGPAAGSQPAAPADKPR
jgi:TolA-binding protein